ncbi:MAG: hypothetical protein OES32_12720 [Acidobacteriota bacterium]|nr:hypothetical protein [Acidobacteriota bacterium]
MPRSIQAGFLSLSLIAVALTIEPALQAADAPRLLQKGGIVVGDPVVGIPVDIDLRTLPIEEPWKPGDPIREIPRRLDGRTEIVVDTPVRLDPLVELQAGYQAGPPAITEFLNYDGNSSAANPNDPTGDVGLNYFIEMINGPGGSSVTVYDKTDGSLDAGPFPLDTLSPGGVCTSGIGDPIVLYDHLAQRWLLTEFSSSGNGMCIYTSRTSDPIAGGWCAYVFQDTSFPDYPKYGVWPDVYLATSNQNANGPNVYGFDRVNMLSPDGTTCPTMRPVQKFGAPNLPVYNFETLTPVDLDGPPPPPGTPAYFLRHRDEELVGDPPNPATDPVELYEMTVDFDTPANSTFVQAPNIILSDFDSNLCPPITVFSCVPQPSGPPLDPLLEVVMQRASYRNFGTHEVLLGVLQTDVNDYPDHSAERWFEVRGGSGAWSLFQEGTWSPGNEGRFMGMTAMDGDGNIMLAYNVSNDDANPPAVFPSIRYTGRLASDPLNVMTVPETEMATGGASNSSSRYGDYNQMGVDPVDDCTFWFLGMYNPAGKAVRIAAAKFDACTGGATAIFADGFESGDCSAWDFTFPGPC